MPTVEMLIGLPGSGKSTYARERMRIPNLAFDWHSSDAIRGELYGDESVQENPAAVFQLMFKRTIESLRAGRSVIYDATNVNRKRRMNFIKEVKKIFGDRVAFCATVFTVPSDECVFRNAERERSVPGSVIGRMEWSFEVPSKAEGFNWINLYGGTRSDRLDIMLSMACDEPHDNPHHRFSIGEHCLEAERFVRKHWTKIREDIGAYWASCVAIAARYHDIGKPTCRTNVRRNGTIDNYSHFYCHENVGAYQFLSLANIDTFSKPQILDVALLINNHMVFFTDEKCRARRKELYSEEFWKALEWLNKADLSAH